MMFRITALIALIALGTGCNLGDPLTFPGDPNGSPNNDNNNNNEPDGGDSDTGDDGGGPNNENVDTFTVTVDNVTADSQALPAMIPAQSGSFTITADITVEDSCDGCAVQVVVGLVGGSSPPTCLLDEEADGTVEGSSTMDAHDTAETLELVWAAFQESNCGAAIAVAEEQMMFDALGEIEFTTPAALSVMAVTPIEGEVGVPVDASIDITLDGAPDQASVTGRVTLSSPMGNVPSTVSVNGSTITLTPSAPLFEFQTPYTVNVTAGIQSGTRQLEADFSSTFRTVMFIEDEFYRANNEFHGNGFSLAVDVANQCVISLQDDTAPEQRFRFIETADGWSALNSRVSAQGRVLDGGDGSGAGVNGNCSMFVAGDGRESAQTWTFTPNAATPGAFTMNTAQFGPNQALDATNDAPALNPTPRMQPTTDVPRQRWRWTRL